MNKNQYLLEQEEIYLATKKAFCADVLPIELCLTQYAKSLVILREVLKNNPHA